MIMLKCVWMGSSYHHRVIFQISVAHAPPFWMPQGERMRFPHPHLGCFHVVQLLGSDLNEWKGVKVA